MGTWDGEEWIWNLTWRRNLFQWELALIQELRTLLNTNCPRNNREDKMRRSGDLEGNYIVKSFNNIAQQHNFERTLSQEVTDLIWQKKAPPRAELVVWFLLQEKLKTGKLLFELHIIDADEAKCPFCE